MSKQLAIVPVSSAYNGARFRLEMRETDGWGRLKKKRQFTVARATLLRALRDADLEQVRYVEHETTLDQDIAAYQVLATIQAGPGSKLSAAGRANMDTLWTRISKRMKL